MDRRRGFHFALLVGGLALCACGEGAGPRGLLDTPEISHALGALDGEVHLNCLECFEESYAEGHRYFEADFMVASDGRIVLSHDGMEARFGLPVGFSSAQFMAQRLLGKYTPLDGPGLARLFREKTDWYLISDVKTPNVPGLRELCRELAEGGVDCTERVIPHLFATNELAGARELGFENLVFAGYRLRDSWDTAEAAIGLMQQAPEVLALSLPRSWWDAWGKDRLRPTPVPVFLHTVDGPEAAEGYLAQGIRGVYTDSLRPGDLPRAAR
jgi:hypothetical protein